MKRLYEAIRLSSSQKIGAEIIGQAGLASKFSHKIVPSILISDWPPGFRTAEKFKAKRMVESISRESQGLQMIT